MASDQRKTRMNETWMFIRMERIYLDACATKCLMLLFEHNVSLGLIGWEGWRPFVCMRVRARLPVCACVCVIFFPPVMAFEMLFFPSYLNHVALVPPELSNPWVVDMA